MPMIHPKDTNALVGYRRYSATPVSDGGWRVYDHEDGEYATWNGKDRWNGKSGATRARQRLAEMDLKNQRG